MTPQQLFYLYLFFVLVGFIVGLSRYKSLDIGGKIALYPLLLALLSESTTRVLNWLDLNKVWVYHIDVVIEASLISLYFLHVINARFKLQWALAAIVFWIAAELVNVINFQPLNTLDTNLIILENFVIIAMSLYALYRILLNDSITVVTAYPHFWYWALRLLLSSGTFFFWLYLLSTGNRGQYINFAQYVQVFINIIVYAGFAYVFLLYPKKNVADGSK